MMGYASFRQIKIRYSDTGHGRVLVLLHGFPETMEIWDEFSVKLARHFRIIAIDLPGHGETPPIGYQHSMELMAEAVKAVMDHLHLRRYVIVGHSMGGYVALAFAELFHDQVSGLCMFHSTPFSDSPEKKADRDKAIHLVKEDTRHYVNEIIPGLFAPEHRPVFKEDIRELKRIAQGISRQGIINALHGMKDRPKRDWVLQYADYPVLFILGKKDTVVPFQKVMDQTTQVKQADVLVLEDSGHMGFIEEKNRCQDALLKFARKCFRQSP
jgi:pimeloyl-ACP methyl ester carboxylesterase